MYKIHRMIRGYFEQNLPSDFQIKGISSLVSRSQMGIHSLGKDFLNIFGRLKIN